jgi:hypothetical protein
MLVPEHQQQNDKLLEDSFQTPTGCGLQAESFDRIGDVEQFEGSSMLDAHWLGRLLVSYTTRYEDSMR